MKHLWATLGWLLAGLLALLFVSSVLREQWLSAVLLALAFLSLVPATTRLRRERVAWMLHPVARVALVPAAPLALGEWSRLVMGGTTPQKVPPLRLSGEERQALEVPVLFVFGGRDNLVGDPRRAEALVQDVRDASVAILNTGHLIAAEDPSGTNRLLSEFFANDQ